MKKYIFLIVLIIFTFSLSSFAYAEEKITVSAFTEKSSYYPEEEIELLLKIKNTALTPYTIKLFVQWNISEVEYKSAQILLETGETVASEIKELNGGILSLSVIDIFPKKEETDIFKIVFKVKSDAPYGKSDITIISQNAEIITPQIEFSIECKNHIADREKDKYLDDIRLSCENGATIIHTCLSCSAEFFERVEPLGHDIPKWEETVGSCTKNGEKTAECKRCGKTLKEEILAPSHNFSDWKISKQISCIEDGKRERNCKNCGEKEIEIIKSSGHKFSEAVIIKNPTDKETGISEKKCEICSAILKEIIPIIEETKTESEKPKENIKEEINTENTSSKAEEITLLPETPPEETEKIEITEKDGKENKINLIPIIVIFSSLLVIGLIIFLVFFRKRKTKVYNPDMNKEQLPF